MEMKATTIKGQIRSVEREIGIINSTIDQKKKSLDNMQIETYCAQIYVDSISKEELAKLILAGVYLNGDCEGDVYFLEERQESETVFNNRVECQRKAIAGLEVKREQLKVALEDLKELKRQEDAVYKNPEYIQYLRLKKQFEDE